MKHPWSSLLPRLLTAALLLIAMSLVPLRSRAQAFQKLTFQKLVFQAGQETTIAGLRFRLEDPDNPSSPTLWQGPLSIASGSTSCTVDASLIRDVYLSASGKLLLVVSLSGSSTYVAFFNPATCARKWAPIKAFTQSVSVEGNQLLLLPACACEVKGQPCSCSAGRVYALQDNSPPLLQPASSRALTKSKLGIAFTGTRSFAHPPASSTP